MHFTSLDEVIGVGTDFDIQIKQHDNFEWLKQAVVDLEQSLQEFWSYKLGEFL